MFNFAATSEQVKTDGCLMVPLSQLKTEDWLALC